MRPIIGWTLRQKRLSMIWWSVGLVAFISLEMSVYPTIKDQSNNLNNLIKNLPSTVKSLFGAQDLFSPVGYVNSHIFYLLIPLMLAILAIGLGGTLIAKEESDSTIELLLSRPVSRGRLLVAKALGGLMVLAIVSVVATAAIVVWGKAAGLEIPIPRLAFASLEQAVLATLFGALAFAIAATGRWGRRASVGVASLIGLGSYIIASLESSVRWLSWPAKLLPYHYYNPPAALNGSYQWKVTGVFAAMSLALIVVSYFIFRDRDLSGS